ncbi:MAG: carbohydrate ABC transporter permease [Lachnospiraceae bacterium]|nr:carbohydrate ABC transporter permease [Lachnospiraceae bacterium]
MAITDNGRKRIYAICKYAILCSMVFIVLYPMLGVFYASFKTQAEYLSTSSMQPPEDWANFSNFYLVFVRGNVVTGFLNTAVITVAACVTSTLLNTMVAFCLTRFDFKGKNLLDRFYMAASFVPSIIVHLIIFKDFAAAGLVNNLISIIILYTGVDIVTLYLYKQYFGQISVSVDESAIMDGCSYFRVYWNILLPMVRPAITTACIIKITYIYNDFYTAFLYLPAKEKGVMSTVLYRFIGPYSSQWCVIAAGIIVVTIPVFIGFIFAQKQIYKGFSDGAVKG